MYYLNNQSMYSKLEKFVRAFAPERYQYAMSFYRPQDQYNALVAYTLLAILCRQPRIELVRGANDKPFFKSNQDMELSITHNSKFVAVAVSDKPIGIDGEPWQTIDASIIKQVYSENEQRELVNFSELDTVFWTAKEAVSKLKNEDFYSIPKTNYYLHHGLLKDQNDKTVNYNVFDLLEGVITVATEDVNICNFERLHNDELIRFINRFHC